MPKTKRGHHHTKSSGKSVAGWMQKGRPSDSRPWGKLHRNRKLQSKGSVYANTRKPGPLPNPVIAEKLG